MVRELTKTDKWPMVFAFNSLLRCFKFTYRICVYNHTAMGELLGVQCPAQRPKIGCGLMATANTKVTLGSGDPVWT